MHRSIGLIASVVAALALGFAVPAIAQIVQASGVATPKACKGHGKVGFADRGGIQQGAANRKYVKLSALSRPRVVDEAKGLAEVDFTYKRLKPTVVFCAGWTKAFKESDPSRQFPKKPFKPVRFGGTTTLVTDHEFTYRVYFYEKRRPRG